MFNKQYFHEDTVGNIKKFELTLSQTEGRRDDLVRFIEGQTRRFNERLPCRGCPAQRR